MFLGSLWIAMLMGGCIPVTLVSQSVNIAPQGGGQQVTFSGTTGQTIRITLTAAAGSAMEPYGQLQLPDTSTLDTPPIGTVQNGANTSTVALTQTGTYTLFIFDGSNLGGQVAVLVEIP